jgi:drug/metabolite transporter (DMT)-like permease
MASGIFAIISMLCFGISNVYWKIASKDEDYTYLVIFRGLFASILLGLICFFCGQYHFKYFAAIAGSPSLADYSECFLLCLICSLGLIFFLSSLRYQQLSITIPLTAVNVFNILTTVFILHENFRRVYFVSFPLTFVGVLFIQLFRFSSTAVKWNYGVLYALLASFFWGITYPFFKYFSAKIGAIPLSFITEATVTLSSFLWLMISKQERKPLRHLLVRKKLNHYFILTILLIGGTVFFNLSVLQLSILTLSILSSLQLVFSVLIGMIIFNEKLTAQQKVGVLLILGSVILSQCYT